MAEATMWNERYATDDYLYGTEPTRFIATHAGSLTPGSKVLVVADGEGRNSVYLAEQGLSVASMDISPVGADKARRLAARRKVDVEVTVADILEWQWTPDAYDVVVAVFIQFLNPEQRSNVFEGMRTTLRPGGRLLVHGYRREQLEYGTGGPPDLSFLYSESLLAEAFADFEIERLASYDAVLNEGAGHVGASALIDLVARRPIHDER